MAETGRGRGSGAAESAARRATPEPYFEDLSQQFAIKPTDCYESPLNFWAAWISAYFLYHRRIVKRHVPDVFSSGK
jgi:hypothetical protein